MFGSLAAVFVPPVQKRVQREVTSAAQVPRDSHLKLQLLKDKTCFIPMLKCQPHFITYVEVRVTFTAFME